MPNELNPIIDQWYQPGGKEELLRVVAADMDAGLIEVQHFDGSIEELDFDTWQEMDIDLAEEPEDWTGPYDDIEADDLGDADITTTGLAASRNWRAAELDGEAWEDTRPTDEREVEADDQPVEPYASEESPDAEV
jgi:hypothetical protein